MDRYEEALAKARVEYEKARKQGYTWLMDLLEGMFPDLKNSEDEKIIRFFAELATDACGGPGQEYYEELGLNYDKVMGWLKKQKENIEKEYVFRPLAGTDIATAAIQAIRRANEGDHFVFAFNGMYIPVNKYNSAKELVDEYEAYLEKQKERPEELSTRLNGVMQEYVKSGEDEEEQEHRLKCYQLFWDALGDSEFFKQKEQKPAEWSEEDSRILYNVIAYVGYAAGQRGVRDDEFQEANDWLKSLPIGFIVNPNYNEDMVNLLVAELQSIAERNNCPRQYDGEISWLKSLRPQPRPKEESVEEKIINFFDAIGDCGFTQAEILNLKSIWKECGLPSSQPRWKPSEEQMGMLLAVINDPNNAGAESCHLMLQSLYADLQKLLSHEIH